MTGGVVQTPAPSVIPAKAGISLRKGAAANHHEIPAFAGMAVQA